MAFGFVKRRLIKQNVAERTDGRQQIDGFVIGQRIVVVRLPDRPRFHNQRGRDPRRDRRRSGFSLRSFAGNGHTNALWERPCST